MLELKHIYKKFKNKKVLEDINLIFESKGFIAITGESGSGKTTLINIIAGIESADSGEYIFDGKNMIFEKESERIKSILKYVSYMPQSQILLYNKTVYENLKEILNLYNLTDESQIDFILNQVHLNETYKNRIVSTLSTGEAQRVCIAMSLLKRANLLILDEATENLDIVNRELILNILKEISKTRLVILVTHDTSLAEKYVDRLITISNRKIYSDVVLDNSRIPFIKESNEEEQIKGRRKKRLNLPLKNILFYLLIPLIFIFLIAQISIWIKPNISSESNCPLSHFKKDPIKKDGAIYAEDTFFTQEELKKIYEEENTYFLFNDVCLFGQFLKGFIDYDFNYKISKTIASFDEFIVSDTFLELNPTFMEKYSVIETIKTEKPVLIINYELTWKHFFPNESMSFELVCKAFQEDLFSKTTIITKDEKKTLSLDLPIVNEYEEAISNYYKSVTLELSFGTTICALMILLSLSLFIVLAIKQAPYYYKIVAFYRVCGKTNLEIRGKLKMDFYIFPLIFIILCSGIVSISVFLIFKKIGYNHELFRFDATTYWVSFTCSLVLLIVLNELMNFLIFKSKLKKLIKTR
ncbi:MAG: ABC transporter ATP-binding protein [Roseburia sp.]|nr:ABC transporter ATP-binding protein [Anaeroplasma bactoclasticum]MCM1195886.1 ABC transporter ATP-binding protein [Roseburia sp.]MCM1556231.1 ABC transporter ATP-binding protein [Anaeroplasma bactoclasticum]